MVGSSPSSAPQSSRDITRREGPIDVARLAAARAIAARDAARTYSPSGNALGEWVTIREAEASGRPWAVPLRPGVVVVDVDGSSRAVELVAAAAAAVGLPAPVASRPASAGHAHLILNVEPTAAAQLLPVLEDIAAALDGPVDVKRGPTGWLRPPGTPHREGGRARLLPGLLGELAGALDPDAADDAAACRLVAWLAARLAVARPHEERLGVAAYDPAGARWRCALDRRPAARGLDPTHPESSERVVWDAVAAGLAAGVGPDQLVHRILEAPAGIKARTTADGRARRDPVGWLRADVRRILAKLDRPRPEPRDEDELDAAAAAVDAWTADLRGWPRAADDPASGDMLGRRLDRAQATMRELLRRARHTPTPEGPVTASHRSLGRAIAAEAATARRALADLERAGLITTRPGDRASARPTTATLHLDHPLLQLPQGGETTTARGSQGACWSPGEVGTDTLSRHDAWRVTTPAGERVTGSLRTARPLWRRLRTHGAATLAELAGHYGTERTLRRHLGRLADAGLVRELAGGRWAAVSGPVTGALDARARAQGTAGAGLTAALRHACERAARDAWSPAGRGQREDPALAALPPPPDEPPDWWDRAGRGTARGPRAA